MQGDRSTLLLGPWTELHLQGHLWEEEKAMGCCHAPILGLGKLVSVLSAKTSFTSQQIPPDLFWISQGILDIPGWFSQLPWPGISQCTRARCSCWGHLQRNTHILSSPRAWERQSDGKRGKPDPETGREELGGRFPSAGLWAAALSCWKIPTPTSAFQKH